MAEVAEPEVQKEASTDGALWDSPEIQSLQRGETPQKATEVPVKEPVEPVVTTDEKVWEPTKDAPKDPVVDTSTWTPKARENFARVEEARKKDREQFQADFEKARQERQAEIEARDKELTELRHRTSLTPDEITKRDQEIATLRGELKHVALERDPDFLNRYVTPKTQLIASLKDMTAGSVTPEDFDRAFRRGDQEKLDEMRDALQPHQQRRWDATLLNMEQLDIQKDLALQNRDTTYNQILQERQQRQQETVKERFNQNLQAAREVEMEAFEKVPHLREDQELVKRVNSMLNALAGGEGAQDWDSKKILRHAVATEIQSKILMQQHELLQSQGAELQEKVKKIEELEAFIQSKHEALPNTQVTSETKPKEDSRPIWEQFQQPNSNGSSAVPKGREFI